MNVDNMLPTTTPTPTTPPLHASADDENNNKSDISPFKEVLNRHKRRGNDPNRVDDLDHVMDVFKVMNDCNDTDCLDDSVNNRFYRIDTSSLQSRHSHCVYKGPAFGIHDFPGCTLMPQAINEELQLQIAYESVTQYCQAPYRTNIDSCPPKHNEIINNENYDETMWKIWKRQQRQQQQHRLADSKHINSSFDKLSWSTMGYHYDWTERSYNQNYKSHMPKLISKLSSIFATTSTLILNTSSNNKQTDTPTFIPSASIVNYYTTKSIMGGHIDDLEYDMDKPIISMNIGLPAIFILGQTTKQTQPVVAMLLRPGDVLCMDGPSRLYYHAMARVIPYETTIQRLTMKTTMKNPFQITQEQLLILLLLNDDSEQNIIPKEDRQYLIEYLHHHRININVRQVYSDDDIDQKKSFYLLNQ